jgi:YVTN family beta-propeller protein
MTARLLCVIIAIITFGIAIGGGDSASVAVADEPWYDITDSAVQTFYQDYVPQIDRRGNTLTDYGPSSFLPLGIYYPEACNSDAAQTLRWLPLDNPEPPPNTEGYSWDGDYSVAVFYSGEDVPFLSETVARYDGAGTRVGDAVEVSIKYLPANVPLAWWPFTVWTKGDDSIVWPPYGLTPLDPIGQFEVPCPGSDADDPNPVETLAAAGFNAAITGPSILNTDEMLELKQQASGASDFVFVPSVIDDAFGCKESACGTTHCVDWPFFSEYAFNRYGQSENVLGFYIDDEPLLRAYDLSNPTGQCPVGLAEGQMGWYVQTTLENVQAKYDRYKEQTDRALFFAEGPFGGDWWDDFDGIGDAACHDRYPDYTLHETKTPLMDVARSMTAQTTRVASDPWAIAVNPVDGRIYVTNYYDNSVWGIDGTSGAHVQIPTHLRPTGIAINRATNRIYVANYLSDSISVFDAATGEEIDTDPNAEGVNPIGVLYRPKNLAVNSVTNRIYASVEASNEIAVIDGASNTVIARTAPFPGSDVTTPLSGIAVNPNTNRIYVAGGLYFGSYGFGEIWVFDASTNKVVIGAVVGNDPAGIAVNSQTNRVYVANKGSDSVSVLNASTNAVVATIAVGSRPEGVAVDESANRVYVTNSGDGTISVLDGAVNAEIDMDGNAENGVTRIAVGRSPRSVAVGSDSVYVANYESRSVSVIDRVTGSVRTIADVGGRAKPSWLTAEAFSWDYAFPTPDQMRGTVYDAVIHGATGFWYFLWDGPSTRKANSSGTMVGVRPALPAWYPENGRDAEGNQLVVATLRQRQDGERLWQALAGDAVDLGLNAEITSLAPVIFAPTSDEEYRVYANAVPGANGLPSVHTMLKYKDGYYYLLAVNMDVAAGIRAKFAFGMSDVTDAEVEFESRTVTATAEGDQITFVDDFGPSEAHVYKFKADSDGDGVANQVDNCPTVYNPDQHTSDGEPRSNGPEIREESASNPAIDRPSQSCDDPADVDDDNDGLLDTGEHDTTCPYRLVSDSDGDGQTDGHEVTNGSDPCAATARAACTDTRDGDGDGLNNCVERAGYNTCASANDAAPGWSNCANPMDSDGDGCADTLEVMDVNGDRKVSINDQTFLSKRAARLIPPSISDAVLDINKDGRISIGDQTLMAKSNCNLQPWLLGCEQPHTLCPAE